MRISTKGRYGTRAMVYLGENFGKEPVSLRELAEEEDISLKYMEQIVPLLKKSGLIRSIRGARGGYVLTRRPENISLRDILVALEGRWSLVECLTDQNQHPGGAMRIALWIVAMPPDDDFFQQEKQQEASRNSANSSSVSPTACASCI